MTGKQWQRCTILTATLFPGIVFSVFLGLDLLVWSYGSTGAVPFLRYGIIHPLSHVLLDTLAHTQLHRLLLTHTCTYTYT